MRSAVQHRVSARWMICAGLTPSRSTAKVSARTSCSSRHVWISGISASGAPERTVSGSRTSSVVTRRAAVQGAIGGSPARETA